MTDRGKRPGDQPKQSGAEDGRRSFRDLKGKQEPPSDAPVPEPRTEWAPQRDQTNSAVDRGRKARLDDRQLIKDATPSTRPESGWGAKVRGTWKGFEKGRALSKLPLMMALVWCIAKPIGPASEARPAYEPTGSSPYSNAEIGRASCRERV